MFRWFRFSVSVFSTCLFVEVDVKNTLKFKLKIVTLQCQMLHLMVTRILHCIQTPI